MIYDDTIVLNQHGGSRCYIIPAKWLKANDMEELKYVVHIHIEGNTITLEPAEGRYPANKVAKGGQIMASTIKMEE